MLTLQNTKDFIDSLAFAGFKPPCYDKNSRLRLEEDMQREFANATREEMLQACAILKQGDHWPQYQEIAAALNSLRSKAHAEEKQTLEDAYPEGEAWEEYTQMQMLEQLHQNQEELSPGGLLAMHWYLTERQVCNACQGTSCAYSGHKPRLRISPNGKEAYPCVEQVLCKHYHARAVALASVSA